MTTTTERIAQAVAPIIAEAMREYRERIAQLEISERLTSVAHNARAKERDEALATIDDLNRQLDEAHKENARLVLERPYHTAPVVEEQGPWVVYDSAETRLDYMFASLDPEHDTWTWSRASIVDGFPSKSDAEKWRNRIDLRTCRVITLAEARAIEAKRG